MQHIAVEIEGKTRIDQVETLESLYLSRSLNHNIHLTAYAEDVHALVSMANNVQKVSYLKV